MRPLRQLSLAEAQESCNFVVLEPGDLPRDCGLGATTLRPEAPPGRPEGIDVAAYGQTPYSPANPCSLRTHVAGAGRSLRVKQFLYDWAPPAAGIASLWESPMVEPFECSGAVGWIGTDYHGVLGGCVSLERTMVEVAVVDGHFQRAELQSLMRGLRVANPARALAIQDAPMHRLNYWVHYRIPPYRTPPGLWRYPHRRLYDRGRLVTLVELGGIQNTRPLLPSLADVSVDSLLLMVDPDANHHEIEVIARRAGDPNDMLWMTGMNASSARAIPLPPEPAEGRAAEIFGSRQARGTTVWVAALTERFGAWEVFWEEAGFHYAVWFSPSTFWNEARVLALVESLEPAFQRTRS